MVLRGYFWTCPQESFLEVSGGTYRILGFKLGSTACKVSDFPSVLYPMPGITQFPFKNSEIRIFVPLEL